MAIKVGISGFGRIGRVVIRAAMNMPEIVLSSDIVSYFGSLKAEISFNIYSL